MNETSSEKIVTAIGRFIDWLDDYGETSYDHQSFFASDLGRSAKALYYRRPLLGRMAVAPMIFCEAFVPSALNLAVLLYGRSPELDKIFSAVVTDLLVQWHKPDGSFRARKLVVGWDNVPMHRLAQSQMFRSLCFFLSRNINKSQDRVAHHTLQPLGSKATE